MLLLHEVNGVNGFITYYLLITVLVTGDAEINITDTRGTLC